MPVVSYSGGPSLFLVIHSKRGTLVPCLHFSTREPKFRAQSRVLALATFSIQGYTMTVAPPAPLLYPRMNLWSLWDSREMVSFVVDDFMTSKEAIVRDDWLARPSGETGAPLPRVTSVEQDEVTLVTAIFSSSGRVKCRRALLEALGSTLSSARCPNFVLCMSFHLQQTWAPKQGRCRTVVIQQPLCLPTRFPVNQSATPLIDASLAFTSSQQILA